MNDSTILLVVHINEHQLLHDLIKELVVIVQMRRFEVTAGVLRMFDFDNLITKIEIMVTNKSITREKVKVKQRIRVVSTSCHHLYQVVQI